MELPRQGSYLKTRDFLQPLERLGNAAIKEETNMEVEQQAMPLLSMEHHCSNQILCFSQRISKPEGTLSMVAQASNGTEHKENKPSATFSGGFTTGEESSSFKKRKTEKENLRDNSNFAKELAVNEGQQTTLERGTPLSSDSNVDGFSSFSSSKSSGQKCQSFMDLIKSAEHGTLDDDMDDEVEFVIKEETSSSGHDGDLRGKTDEKSSNQKANTLRSKHSAAEQRRRNKINDRLQKLRDIIPRSNQKRDKASFLSEVIEYVQLLQEKVKNYEGSLDGWSGELSKSAPVQRKDIRHVENYLDLPQACGMISGAGPTLLLPAKCSDKNITIPHTIHQSVGSGRGSITAIKKKDNHPEIMPALVFDAKNLATLSQPQSKSSNSNGAVSCHKLKEQDQIAHNKSILSVMHSKRLVNTLTQALRSSGVDLSPASISVQIELSKQDQPNCHEKYYY